MKHVASTLGLLFIAISGLSNLHALGPGDRIAVNRGGKHHYCQIIELISGDSKAVVKFDSGERAVILIADVDHAVPELIDPQRMRTWKSAQTKHTIQAVFIRMKDEAIFLQKEDGSVVRVNASLVSQADREYAHQQQRRIKPVAVQSGDAIQIVVGGSPPVDENAIIGVLTRSLERSGYVVANDAAVQLNVGFQTEATEVIEMFSLQGKRTIRFTPRTVSVTLVASGKELLRESYTTKEPDTIPAGAAGERSLRGAELAILPFIRTLTFSPRIPAGG